jgi:hypothetical protein
MLRSPRRRSEPHMACAHVRACHESGGAKPFVTQDDNSCDRYNLDLAIVGLTVLGYMASSTHIQTTLNFDA